MSGSQTDSEVEPRDPTQGLPRGSCRDASASSVVRRSPAGQDPTRRTTTMMSNDVSTMSVNDVFHVDGHGDVGRGRCAPSSRTRRRRGWILGTWTSGVTHVVGLFCYPCTRVEPSEIAVDRSPAAQRRRLSAYDRSDRCGEVLRSLTTARIEWLGVLGRAYDRSDRPPPVARWAYDRSRSIPAGRAGAYDRANSTEGRPARAYDRSRRGERPRHTRVTAPRRSARQ